MLRTQIDSQCTQPVSSVISATAALHQTWTDSFIFHGKLWGEKHSQLQHLCWRNQWLLHVWREATLPVSMWRNITWVTSSQPPFFLDKAYTTLYNETSTSEGCFLGIGWHWLVSLNFFLFFQRFSKKHLSSHAPCASMRHAGLRSFKVPCFTTGATGGREMQARSCDGRNLKSWRPKNGSFFCILLVSFAKNWCCCMLL